MPGDPGHRGGPGEVVDPGRCRGTAARVGPRGHVASEDEVGRVPAEHVPGVPPGQRADVPAPTSGSTPSWRSSSSGSHRSNRSRCARARPLNSSRVQPSSSGTSWPAPAASPVVHGAGVQLAVDHGPERDQPTQPAGHPSRLSALAPQVRRTGRRSRRAGGPRGRWRSWPGPPSRRAGPRARPSPAPRWPAGCPRAPRRTRRRGEQAPGPHMVSSVITAPPPADWPPMVTRRGRRQGRDVVPHPLQGQEPVEEPRFAGASGSQPNPSKPSR